MTSVDIGLGARAEMPVRSRRPAADGGAERSASRPSGVWLRVYLGTMAFGALVVCSAVAATIDVWSPEAAVVLFFVTITALWISGGAASALIGLLQAELSRSEPPRAEPSCSEPSRSEPSRSEIAPSWHPTQNTAILVLICGEPADALAAYLRSLHHQLGRSALGDKSTIFVLSDTRESSAIAAERSVMAPLIAAGAVRYRRRRENLGRKPGNIADWLSTHGNDFDFMVVLDADSRLSTRRVRTLIHHMEQRPDLGLLQAGISMVPGRSRFGRHQRLSNRLLSPNFGRGLAAWSGDAGNYWGHNAIMRVAAFRAAASLPVLSGAAPFGGPPLSHDFIEAAWIRRAGWSVALDPDTRGSAEDGPQTLAEFHRRDRRWCQGNLQHLRLISEPGLDPVSRLHLASGIAGYLVAPIWLALVLLIATGVVAVNGVLPLLVISLILVLPKIGALAFWMRKARTPWRRRVLCRASLSELCLSTVIAPLIMLRQSGAVLSVALGRDCGWKPSGSPRFEAPSGALQSGFGIGLLALGAGTGSSAAAVWLLPVAFPLMLAPLLQRWLDQGA